VDRLDVEPAALHVLRHHRAQHVRYIRKADEGIACEVGQLDGIAAREPVLMP
jgi:hypothetical protein